MKKANNSYDQPWGTLKAVKYRLLKRRLSGKGYSIFHLLIFIDDALSHIYKIN